MRSTETVNTRRPDRAPEPDPRELARKKIERSLHELQTRINGEFLDIHGIKDLLTPDCSVNMAAFATKNGGPYRKTPPEGKAQLLDGSIDGDRLEVERIETTIGSEIAAEEGFDHRSLPPEVLRAKYREKREKSSGALLENALTVMLHKIIGDRFLVVKASPYDDIKNGVDHLIIDRETGNVVCSVDDVNDEKTGNRTQAKMDRIIKKSQDVGTVIKYGLTFDTTQGPPPPLKREGMSGIPSFYLRVSRSELKKLLADMGEGIASEPSETELRLFDRLVGELDEQRTELDKKTGVRHEVHLALTAFADSLKTMKDLRARYNDMKKIAA